MKKTQFSFLRHVTFLYLSIFLLISNSLYSQPGCPNVNAGNNQTINCNANCTDLTATFLQTGQTNAYAVSSVPYAPPYAFNTGTAIMVNIDDRWSSVINLPFAFCFFGNNYNQIVVGSNGVITFNTGNAGGHCPWSFTATCPSPNLPTNAVFGVYHDIDPSVSGNLYYAILGTAPCRTFVVNFNQVAMYSCTSLKATHQIVLYESTNVIEVYIQNKPLCGSWNSGNGLVGIQNATGTLGYAPPGRNTSQWTASNEAWRFTPNGPANYTVAWLQGATQIGTTPTVNVCPTQTTTYTAQVTYTNCNGSQIVVADNVTVALTNPPVVSVSPANATVCMGQSQTLTASGANSYTWSPASGLSATTGASVTATPTTTTTYTVTGSTNGCTATATAVVTVSGGPIVSFPALANVCISVSPFPLTGGNPAGGIYSGNGVSNGVFSPTLAGVGTHTITYTFTDAQNCVGTATQTITVNPLPQADAGNDQTICNGQNVTLTATGGSSYLWSTQSPTATINVSPTTTTTFTVAVSDANGCSASDAVVVTVLPSPSANAGTDVAICNGQSTQLSASGGSIYQWTPANTLDNAAIANPVATPISTTTYTLTVTEPGGCSATDGVVVIVNPLPVANAGNDISVCEGIATALNATGGQSYLWSPANGLSATGISNPTATPLVTTTYTVTVSDANNCTDTDDVIISVFQNPTISFSSDKNNGCRPLLVNFTDNTSATLQSWQWQFGDPGSGVNNTSQQQNPSHLYDNSGVYSVSLSATTQDGCYGSFTANQMVEVYPNPVASFTIHPTAPDINNPLVSFQCQSMLAAVWHWNFGDAASGGDNYCTDATTAHNFNIEGTYLVTLLVESQHGCIDSASREVTVETAFTFFVPNSFTPDGDGWNDFFKGYGENITEYYMAVFCRWGSLVFETDDYNNPWDGRKFGSGDILPQDVYAYKFIIKDQKGKKRNYYGYVTLLK